MRRRTRCSYITTAPDDGSRVLEKLSLQQALKGAQWHILQWTFHNSTDGYSVRDNMWSSIGSVELWNLLDPIWGHLHLWRRMCRLRSQSRRHLIVTNWAAERSFTSVNMLIQTGERPFSVCGSMSTHIAYRNSPCGLHIFCSSRSLGCLIFYGFSFVVVVN